MRRNDLIAKIEALNEWESQLTQIQKTPGTMIVRGVFVKRSFHVTNKNTAKYEIGIDETPGKGYHIVGSCCLISRLKNKLSSYIKM